MLNQKIQKKSVIAIKRVITQGELCICGICRKTYRNMAQATACLTRCLSGHLNPSNPVVAIPDAGAKKYRCHFCRRVYVERRKALECANACKTRATAIVATEHSEGNEAKQARLSATQSEGNRQPSPRKPLDRRNQMHKFFRDGRTLVCRKCGSEKKTLDEVIDCFDSHPEKVKKTLAEKNAITAKKSPPNLKVVTPPSMENEITSKVARLTNENDKFLRDGARYVCRTCGNKFFTRDDVFTCFDSHSGKQAVNKIEPEATATPTQEAKSQKQASGDDENKFFRDGARYVCRNCQAKHFTRGEVIACFDKHNN